MDFVTSILMKHRLQNARAALEKSDRSAHRKDTPTVMPWRCAKLRVPLEETQATPGLSEADRPDTVTVQRGTDVLVGALWPQALRQLIAPVTGS